MRERDKKEWGAGKTGVKSPTARKLSNVLCRLRVEDGEKK